MKFKALFLFAAIAIMAFGMNCTRIAPGHVGIEVSMAGSNRGVQDIPVRTGWVFYNPMGTNVIEYPTFVQTAVWTKSPGEGHPSNEEISFNSKDGLTFFADVNLSYHLDSNKVPSFYLTYMSKDIDTFTHGLMRQVARDEFNNLATNYTAEEIYGVRKEEFVNKVRARINEHFANNGVVVETLGFIGAPRPPQSFTEAINGKLTAIQRSQQAVNELQETKAQADKLIAKAEGEAKSNQIKAASLTPAVIEWRKLEIQQAALSKWNGSVPQFVGANTPTPFFDVTKH